MSFFFPKSWTCLLATLVFTVVWLHVPAEGKNVKGSTQKNGKPTADAPIDTGKVIIKANDPKAFTKAILLEKKGIDYEIVEERKNNTPKLVIKEKTPSDFFDFSSMLVPITHKAAIASKYGIRNHRLHRGVDVLVIQDEPVVAALPGKVIMSKYNKGGYGHYVIVEHEDGIQTLYGHLSKRLVKVGDPIYPGDIVGLAGNSGRSSGAHLHFEIRYGDVNIDPETVIDFPNWDLKKGANAISKKKVIRDHNSLQWKLKHNNAYIAKKGDTQGKVAKWFNISIEALCRINSLVPGAPLKVGQRLHGSK